MGHWSLYWPSALHFVHHTSDLVSLPFLRSCNSRVRLVSWLYICCTPAWVSPISKASSFIAISNALAWVAILCCVKGNLICSSSVAMNHSLCCSGGILKLTWPINTLNHWSNSHTNSIVVCLVSFSSVIQCDSNFEFLNYDTNAFLISSNEAVELVTEYFIYQVSTLSRSNMMSCTLFTSSLVICLVVHNASTIN